MWTYNGKIVDEKTIEGYVAFVYLITNNETGKAYIGKKRLNKLRTKPPLKGKTRKRKIRTESNWREYYGSSKLLQEDVDKLGADKFTREILRLCKTLSEASYYEAWWQFKEGAIMSDKYYNESIDVRVHSRGVAHLKESRDDF